MKPMANVETMPDQSGIGPCPDREYVSCFLDEELPRDSGEARHIAACERCGITLAAYREIGCELRREMAEAVPADLAHRVMAHVRRRAEETSSVAAPVVPAWFLRVAAAVALVALGALGMHGLYSLQPPAAPHRPETSGPNATLVPSAPPAVAQTVPSAPSIPAANPDTGGMSAGDFAPVLLGEPPHFIRATVPAATPVPIPQVVRHVWLTADPKDCCAQFAEAAAACGIGKIAGNNTLDPDGTAQLAFSATRRQLVELVRTWSAQGYRLLSPTPPQPEQKLFSGSGNELVTYTAVFVPAGK